MSTETHPTADHDNTVLIMTHDDIRDVTHGIASPEIIAWREHFADARPAEGYELVDLRESTVLAETAVPEIASTHTAYTDAASTEPASISETMADWRTVVNLLTRDTPTSVQLHDQAPLPLLNTIIVTASKHGSDSARMGSKYEVVYGGDTLRAVRDFFAGTVTVPELGLIHGGFMAQLHAESRYEPSPELSYNQLVNEYDFDQHPVGPDGPAYVPWGTTWDAETVDARLRLAVYEI